MPPLRRLKRWHAGICLVRCEVVPHVTSTRLIPTYCLFGASDT